MSEREVSSFWDHLDVLRRVLFRCLTAWAIAAIAAFCFKDVLFSLLFAPSTDDFVSYQVEIRASLQLAEHGVDEDLFIFFSHFNKFLSI